MIKYIQRHDKTKEHIQNAEFSRRISPLSHIGNYISVTCTAELQYIPIVLTLMRVINSL